MFFFLVAVAPGDAAAEAVKPEIEYEYKYYDVPLTDAALALEEAAEKTRLSRGGQKALSSGKVKMGYNYMPRQLPDGACRVLEYEVKLECEITLPRFKSDDAEVLKKAEPWLKK